MDSIIFQHFLTVITYIFFPIIFLTIMWIFNKIIKTKAFSLKLLFSVVSAIVTIFIFTIISDLFKIKTLFNISLPIPLDYIGVIGLVIIASFLNLKTERQ